MAPEIIREARRRANLSQRTLAERAGRPQATVARWESGRNSPSLHAVRELVRACGLDLEIGLRIFDDSYGRETRRLRTIASHERLRHLVDAANNSGRMAARAAGRSWTTFDPVGMLRALRLADVEFLLLGDVAAALHGSALIPTSVVAIATPNDPAVERRLERVLERLNARSVNSHGLDPAVAARRWHVPRHGTELVRIERPPGTSGYRDLAKNARRLSASEELEVPVAALADLVRIAGASPDPGDRRVEVALRAALEVAASEDSGRVA
jgi:transcriptional regulator with XRE-family HTH domain